MSGYVYLLHCQSRYKIGIAGNVAKRLSDIQTSNPFKVELVASTKVETPFELERELHTTFAHRRVLREWFNLTPDEVGAVLSIFQEKHRPNIDEEVKQRKAKAQEAVKQKSKEPRPVRIAPNREPMPECYWISNRRQKRTKYMLSKEDGLGLFCSYLAWGNAPCMIGNSGHTVKVKGFKDRQWFEDAIAHLEDAEFCVCADFGDEDLSIVIFGANAVKNAKGQTYFIPIGQSTP